MKKVLFGVLVSIVFGVLVFADTFSDGMKAYESGNHKKAVTLFNKACEGGNATGCNNLGLMYDNGQGVKQDYHQAVKLYTKACEGGNAAGCSNLGLMYANGQGVKQDYHQAKELFGKACDGGEQVACDNYAILNKQGY